MTKQNTQEALVYRLADIAALAQLQFQQQYLHIDPIIGVNRQMRAQGFAVDLLTIECAVTKKRITLLIEDGKPQQVQYQFGRADQDPSGEFESVMLTELDQQRFFELMVAGLAK